MIVLRLPGSVKEVFEERSAPRLPLRAEKVLARTREVRGGQAQRPALRHRGRRVRGVYADGIAQLFEHDRGAVWGSRGGANPKRPGPPRPSGARAASKQLRLF